MESESKLVPVLRDAVNIIKMVLFKELKTHLASKFPRRDSIYIGRLAGAVVNEVFDTPNTSPLFVQFAADNQLSIVAEVNNISSNFNHLSIPLTDALRVQFLCDSLEGVDSGPMLKKAEKIGILISDRDVPLPKTFMELVRRIGAAHHILEKSPDTNGEGE